MDLGGCAGCFNKDQDYKKTRDKAVQYASEQGKTVAIYKEGSEYKYIIAELTGQGGYAVFEYISQYANAAPVDIR